MQKPDDILKKILKNQQVSMQTSSNDETLESMTCRLCGKSDAICDGLGVIRYDVPLGDEHFGKLHRCPNYPVNLDKDRQDRFKRLSNLAAFSDKQLNNFVIENSGYSKLEQESLKAALNLAVSFSENPEGWILFTGKYGSGKTHLAAAIGNARIVKGDMVLFVTSPDLLDHLRISYSNPDVSYDETFERLKSVQLLILDDLGVENPSPWAKEKLFQLLNHRYTHKLPTVITTNADFDQLDPRLTSRMLDLDSSRRVVISAPDYRSMNYTDRGDVHGSLVSALGNYSGYTFDTFDASTNLNQEERQNAARVLKAAREYVESPHSQWFVIVGKSGTGKTHIAAAMANAWKMRARGEVFFITVADLMDDLRMTFSPASASSPTFYERFQQVKNAEFMVLDDLTVGNSSDWAREKLLQIVDYRYVKRKSTVFTLSTINAVEERIKNRLLDSRLSRRLELTIPPYVMRDYRR